MSDGSDDTTEIFITLSLRIIPNPATDAAVGWCSLVLHHRTFTLYAPRRASNPVTFQKLTGLQTLLREIERESMYTHALVTLTHVQQ